MGARHVISKVSVDKRSSAHRIVWLYQVGGLRGAAIGGQRIRSASTRQITAFPANGSQAAGNGISGTARGASAGLRGADCQFSSKQVCLTVTGRRRLPATRRRGPLANDPHVASRVDRSRL